MILFPQEIIYNLCKLSKMILFPQAVKNLKVVQILYDPFIPQPDIYVAENITVAASAASTTLNLYKNYINTNKE